MFKKIAPRQEGEHGAKSWFRESLMSLLFMIINKKLLMSTQNKKFFMFLFEETEKRTWVLWLAEKKVTQSLDHLFSFQVAALSQTT